MAGLICRLCLLKIGAVVDDGRMQGEELFGAPVEGEGAFFFPEGVIAAHKAQKRRESARIGRFKVSLLRMIAAGEGGFKPEDGFFQAVLRLQEAPQFAADGSARLPEKEALKEHGKRLFGKPLRFVAEGKHLARLDFVDIPAVALQHAFKARGGFLIAAVIIKLPPEIEGIARGKRFFFFPLFVDAEVSLSSLLFAPEMADGKGIKALLSEGDDAFVHPPDPMRHGAAAEDALAAKDKRGRIVLPHAFVREKERVGAFLFEKGAESGKAFVRWGREDVVRVHPEEIVARRLGKGKVAGSRKVVLPGEIIDENAEGAGDLPRVVFGARIDDDDLIKKPPNAFQTARKDGFFVFYDHAEGKGTHMPPRPHFMRPFAVFATILREIAALYHA